MMSEEREVIHRNINAIRKQLSEKNTMDKLRKAFEDRIKHLRENTEILDCLHELFDNYGEIGYEQLFRDVGGKEFTEANKNKDLDAILKSFAEIQAGKIPQEVKDDLFVSFLHIYKS